MTLPLILITAAITYGSRALSLVVLPEPGPRLRLILDRVPAPLFAGLAATSLIQPGGAKLEAWGTTLGALAAAPARSLLWSLIGGGVGYAIFALL